MCKVVPSTSQVELCRNYDFFLGMKNNPVLYNIFLNVQERTKGIENVVAFGDI